jgi:hypothetical protein
LRWAANGRGRTPDLTNLPTEVGIIRDRRKIHFCSRKTVGIKENSFPLFWGELGRKIIKANKLPLLWGF